MSPVYFCDRNLGKRFGEELRQQGLAAEFHDDHFPPDEDLLRHVAAQGWVLTGAKRYQLEKLPL